MRELQRSWVTIYDLENRRVFITAEHREGDRHWSRLTRMSQETDRYTLLGDGHEVLSVELQLDSRGNVIAIPPGLNFNLMGSMTILPGHEPLYMWWHRSQKLFTGPDPMWRDLLADEDLDS